MAHLSLYTICNYSFTFGLLSHPLIRLTGAAGNVGPPGARGPKGEQGETGAASQVPGKQIPWAFKKK